MKTFQLFPEFSATAGHIAVLQAKLDQLQTVKADSWEQLILAVSRRHQAGGLSLDELYELCVEMQQSYGPGFTKIWNRLAPMAYSRLRAVVYENRRREVLKWDTRPNGPNGSWFGRFPLEMPYPRVGVAVVYVLFDETNEPCYVGSTEEFRVRMNAHLKEKLGLAAWVAYPCRDREHAYELEVDLLHQHKPRMNKKAGR